jgi:hypothetical protein
VLLLLTRLQLRPRFRLPVTPWTQRGMQQKLRKDR